LYLAALFFLWLLRGKPLETLVETLASAAILLLLMRGAATMGLAAASPLKKPE